MSVVEAPIPGPQFFADRVAASVHKFHPTKRPLGPGEVGELPAVGRQTKGGAITFFTADCESMLPSRRVEKVDRTGDLLHRDDRAIGRHLYSHEVAREPALWCQFNRALTRHDPRNNECAVLAWRYVHGLGMQLLSAASDLQVVVLRPDRLKHAR